MTEAQPLCAICGRTGADISTKLVEYTDEAIALYEVPRYTVASRCDDRDACRARVELENGDPWPLNDRTPAPRRTDAPSIEVAPSVPDQSPAAELEEAGAWLG